MGARESEVVYLLKRHPAKSPWESWQVFSRRGCLFLLVMQGGKRPPVVGADWFDLLEVQLAQGRGNDAPTRVTEGEVIRSHRFLARDTGLFHAAAGWSEFLVSNFPDGTDTAAVFDLISLSLRALEQGKAIPAVYFKFAYLAALREGYPVKEQWLVSLNPGSRDQVKSFLREPIGDFSAELKSLFHGLLRFLSDEAHWDTRGLEKVVSLA